MNEILCDFAVDEVIEQVVAYADVPKTRPQTFVTVERLGGYTQDTVIDKGRYAVQCWAKTRLQASELALFIDQNIVKIIDFSKKIAFVERDNLYNFPEPQGNTARYQLVLELVATF